jgi:hypothetical protein
MESKYNINEIITQVGDIGELISRMNAEDPVPLVEIDIVLDKIRNLYEDVTALKAIDYPSVRPGDTYAKEPDGKQPARKKKSEREVGKMVPPAINEVQASKEIPEPAGIRQETQPDHTGPEDSGEQPAILADKFKGEKKFINESLGENGTRQDLSSKLKSKPIKDIGTALGLNDRFKLINELFNGDEKSYHQTIGILDGASNFNEAFNYISTSYDWDMEDDSVQMLLDLVRRKFIVNKNE